MRRLLHRQIKIAKIWSELVEAVEPDPWGRPYRIVMKKRRSTGHPEMMEMESMLLLEVIGTLFSLQVAGAVSESSMRRDDIRQNVAAPRNVVKFN